jgi:hypothetical protein
VLLETGLTIAKLPAHRYPKRARISSSQPPLLECCDDRLNPPSTPRCLGVIAEVSGILDHPPSRVMTTETWFQEDFQIVFV